MAGRARKLKKPATPTTTIVGANVYRLRVLKPEGSWSRGKLAAISGVSAETIRLLEKNRLPEAEQMSPHMDTIDRLAMALDVEPSKLYENRPTPSSTTGRDHLRLVVPGTGDDLPRRA